MLFKKLFGQRSNHSQKTPNSVEELKLEAIPPLIVQNQQVFDELLTFIDLAEGFRIGFVEVNFGRDTTILIEALREHPECEQIHFAVFNFSNPYIRFVRDEILKVLPTIHAPADKKLVLIIRGLEGAIGMTGDAAPMLQDLNYIRDAFPKSVPHPILFFLPDYALTRLARHAPDFWSWKSGVFRFQTESFTQFDAAVQTLESKRSHGSYNRVEWQSRIDQLQRLAMEYRPMMEREIQGNLQKYLDILIELSRAYNHIGEVTKAETQLKTALEAIDDRSDLVEWKANVLHDLGHISEAQGQIDNAIALHQESLNLSRENNDLKGWASTLRCLTSLKIKQGQTGEAVSNFQKVLDFYERINDDEAKGVTLHSLAFLKSKQGKPEEAIALYQQALEISKHTGNFRGKAATLHEIAILKANQGDTQAAIDLFQQSLIIKERINDVYGKAVTFEWLGWLAAHQQKDFHVALTYLQLALEILQKLQSPNAVHTQELLDRVQKMKAEQENP